MFLKLILISLNEQSSLRERAYGTFAHVIHPLDRVKKTPA
jgi:hypothetical protein